MTRAGPDVLTSCGNQEARLKLNEQYVAGVGGGCSSISDWSPLNSYTADEIEQLRSLSVEFQAGLLPCGALALLPSLSILLMATVVALYQLLE